MISKTIDGKLFKEFVINGCQNLKNDCDNVNALNVFPVPDGDTGTNMKLTIEGGVHILNGEDNANIGEVSKKVSKAMTLSARGNSGVILSQFFKGLSNGLSNIEVSNVEEFANAFCKGVEQAYSAVQNPTEGTILTVMREAGQVAKNRINEESTLNDYFKYYLIEANASLQRTPELLPCLKEAGVIDSGGQGFIRIIEGMAMVLDGNILEYTEANNNPQTIIDTNFNADSVLEYGYCTEFILQLMNAKCDPNTFDVGTIISYLETIGNSIVAFKDDTIIKVHVHTMNPGLALNYCQQFGEFVTLKIENMSVQHSDLKEKVEPLNKKKEHKKYAFVAVSQGEGITDTFVELGVDEIVSGGQTMNPSTEDFVNAFDKLDAEYIIVFPNNSNIIMAAKQAAENYSKAEVRVIKTKSIAECYSALSMLDLSSDDIDVICDSFSEEINNVTTGQITYSIRESEINNIHISKDDYIAIVNHNIVSSNVSKVEVFKQMCQKIEDMENKYVMVLFYGKDMLEEEKNDIREFLQENYPSLEFGEIEGKQDVYSIIVSIE